MPRPWVVMVMSGKGGVGKTTVAVGTAQSLARRGVRVGVADCDLESPALAVIGAAPDTVLGDGYLIPRESHGVLMATIGTMIDPDSPIMLDGETRADMIAQHFRSIRWGDIDGLILDLPPNASREVWALMSLMDSDGRPYLRDRLLGALIVTEPSEPSIASARRAVQMARLLSIPVLGIVENKAGSVYGEGGGRRLSEITDVPLLTSIPLDVSIRIAGDEGREMPDEPFSTIADAILQRAGGKE